MNKITLNAEVKNHINKVSEVSSYLWQREWVERNGGNISINLTDIFGELPENYTGFRFVEVTGFPIKASGKVFFVTGTGERLRELGTPENASCIIKFNEDTSGYYIIWGGLNSENFRATSELISHVKIHIDKEETGSKHKVIIHTHPLELICLSHHPKYGADEYDFNMSCWKMLPEVRAFCPKGIGLVKYILSGTSELGEATTQALRNKDVVVWSKHGVVSTGEDAHVAFDYIDVANKGAKLFLKCLSSGFEPVGMTTDEIDELVRAFNL